VATRDTNAPRSPSSTCWLSITARGIVQGVGFRPFVYNAATRCRLSGWVTNESDAVRIEVAGSRESVERFLDALRTDSPPQARIDQLDVTELDAVPSGLPGTEAFVIRESVGGGSRRPTIPADLATCAACVAEIRDAAERRHAYPFTNCTNCGPRWSIIRQLPYDRPRTSMDGFEMCDACRREYESPADRRFHAQPIACPHCGPRLELVSVEGDELGAEGAALTRAGEAIRAGLVVALKGLGGFQLIADASNEDAVARLRVRKRRPDKPLAVMCGDLASARSVCHVSDQEAKYLASPQAPILLLRRRTDAASARAVAPGVAPGNPYLGVMLPYTPLHHLLLRQTAGGIVVCTSGNRSEEPMAIETPDALRRLGGIADVILTHNRPIVRPVDDSVARVVAGNLQLLRRARGYAPVPIHLNRRVPCVLAVGGHLKNVVGLSLGSDVVLSAHVGDLDNTLSLEVHRRAIADLVEFFGVVPDAVACDAHPDYQSTRHAEALAAAWHVPLIRVQHHHAHLLSLVAEQDVAWPVLGFAWDGTGYGLDRTVWGGETFVCAGADLTRYARLRTFPIPGGDHAAREPRRAALGLLHAMHGSACASLARCWFSDAELATLLSALDRGLFPRGSSMGRLFDAIAALCGLPSRVSFEGQAAMQLEFAAAPEDTSAYCLAIRDDGPLVIDWQPLVEQVLLDRSAGESVGRIAARFHNALAAVAVELAARAGCPRVALSGGCFQNRLLTERCLACLSEAGFEVYTHRQVPPGDGGIALGQILAAALQIEG